ncbi:AraC family transcriptional regulator [Luteolibacter soli]|uniref:AraC family transcriptional regulator ligand-binding domain-containing protein n=1 Tax=Luteolibacter soli TaxID=3135280 RepID=A0ABU9AXN6_9BACT
MSAGKVTGDRFRISSLLAKRLAERGISIRTVEREAGLPPGFLNQEKIHAATAQLFALWKAIGHISGDPAIGLKLGAESRFERFEPIQVAAVCSRTFGDALQRVSRCKILTCPEEIRVQSDGAETRINFVFLQDEGAEPEVLVDVCLAWVVALGSRGSQGQIRPLRVELARTVRHRELFENHFGCRIRFKAGHNAVVFRSEDLARPFATHNEELLKILGAQLDRELDELRSDAGVGELVRLTLKRTLAGGRPGRADVARELHLSVRTLQRRLNDAGLTFQRLVQDTRHELALEYLGEVTIEISEVAFLLGYEDTNSFFRAFHEWQGATPGEWREQHMRSAYSRSTDKPKTNR